MTKYEAVEQVRTVGLCVFVAVVEETSGERGKSRDPCGHVDSRHLVKGLMVFARRSFIFGILFFV